MARQLTRHRHWRRVEPRTAADRAVGQGEWICLFLSLSCRWWPSWRPAKQRQTQTQHHTINVLASSYLRFFVFFSFKWQLDDREAWCGGRSVGRWWVCFGVLPWTVEMVVGSDYLCSWCGWAGLPSSHIW